MTIVKRFQLLSSLIFKSSVLNMAEFLDLSLHCNAETLSLLCSLFKVPVWFQSRKIEMHASLFLPVFEHAKHLAHT